ncbi:hypothetical protein HHK36_020919 [Tetracentron sinense]|uniref:DUF1985 domain-containing protein n=1 Tax=Tetracentron sinense TaxID=13715 RepID=A0A834Z0P7_TETSI|nr:hypothetical protein HHK36_020919 [Tetracentron sinense]
MDFGSSHYRNFAAQVTGPNQFDFIEIYKGYCAQVTGPNRFDFIEIYKRYCAQVTGPNRFDNIEIYKRYCAQVTGPNRFDIIEIYKRYCEFCSSGDWSESVRYYRNFAAQPVYVVFKGQHPGIYNTWEECNQHVSRYRGVTCRSFRTLEEAQLCYEQYLAERQSGNINKMQPNNAAGCCDGGDCSSGICLLVALGMVVYVIVVQVVIDIVWHFLYLGVDNDTFLLLHLMLMRHKGAMEFQVNGKILKFTELDFATILGLNFYPKPTPPLSKEPMTSTIKSRWMADTKVVHKNDLLLALARCMDDVDAVRLALLIFVEFFLLGSESNTKVNPTYLVLVENLEAFNRYPWGSVSYERTTESLAAALHGERHKYNLFGCVFAFQVWIFEHLPGVGRFCGKKVGDRIPRIMQWGHFIRKNVKSIQDEFVDCAELEILEDLHLTEEELQQEAIRDIINSQLQQIGDKNQADPHAHTTSGSTSMPKTNQPEQTSTTFSPYQIAPTAINSNIEMRVAALETRVTVLTGHLQSIEESFKCLGDKIATMETISSETLRSLRLLEGFVMHPTQAQTMRHSGDNSQALSEYHDDGLSVDPAAALHHNEGKSPRTAQAHSRGDSGVQTQLPGNDTNEGGTVYHTAAKK